MSVLDLVVYGAGGMGRELMWQLSEGCDFNLLGFVDDAPEKQGTVINNYPVVGNTQWLLERKEKTAVAIAVANPATRKQIAKALKMNSNIVFPNIIAPDTRVSEFVELGEGCIICCGNVITVNIKIGDFFLSNRCNTIGHDCVIGDFVTLNPMVSVSGNVVIKDNTDIGTGTNIIQGKIIGSDVIIGAGSVIIKDIPDNCTAVGMPAVPIKFHD